MWKVDRVRDGGLLSQTTGREAEERGCGRGREEAAPDEDEGDIGFGPGGIGRVFVWLVTERPLRDSRLEFPALRRLKRSQRALRQGRLLPSELVKGGGAANVMPSTVPLLLIRRL